MNGICCADDGSDDPPPVYQPELLVGGAHPALDMRSGGVLEESYYYHRQPGTPFVAAAPTIEPASGWYGYGFPVRTFRWGWFGAAHYWPFVWWHEGYYGDCCRYAYRRGY